MNTFENVFARGGIRAALATLGLATALMAPAIAEAQQRAEREEAASGRVSEGVVNIQTATAEQLQLLPGIGASKAREIVQSRERRAFRQVQDLMRVRGIGRATFRRLRPMITVNGPTTLGGQSSSD